jgi:hypothetical protein
VLTPIKPLLSTITKKCYNASNRNYSGSREEVQLLADKSFGQPEKKLNFWLSTLINILVGIIHLNIFEANMSQPDLIAIDEEEEFDDMGSYNHSLVQGNLAYLLRQAGKYSVFIELSLDTSSLDKVDFPYITNELIPDICLYPKRTTLPYDILRVTEMPLLQ